MIAQLQDGALVANLGCADAADRVWCDVQPIEGGPRGLAALKFLSPAVGPDGAVPTGPDDSALRAGQGLFDATGPIPCAIAEAQSMGQCDMGVARSTGGYATVVVTLPDGRTRVISFALGRAIGAGFSEADPTGAFSATRAEDLTTVRLGVERYEIPDAVPLGGWRPYSTARRIRRNVSHTAPTTSGTKPAVMNPREMPRGSDSG